MQFFKLEGSVSRDTFPSFLDRKVDHVKEPPGAEEEGDVLRNYFNDVDFEMYGNPDDPFDDPPTSHAHCSSPPRLDGFEGAAENHSEDAPQQSGGRSSDMPDLEGLNLNSKQKRILLKMMPRVMAEELSRQAAKDNDGMDVRSRSPVSSVEYDGPLLPGQTRVRKLSNPKDIQDVRGDPESEEDRRSDPDRKSVV